MEISEKIEKAHYVANEHEVEQLAAAHQAGTESVKRTDGAYLRILVASLHAKFPPNGKRKRKVTPDDLHHQSEHVSETHGRLYHAVLRGVTTPEVKDDETLTQDERRARAGIRNARGTFARSAASTLQGFLKAGGDARTLNVDTVTKYSLRAFVLAKEEPKPKMALVLAAVSRVERQAVKLADEDPDSARMAVEDCISRLQRILLEIPSGHTQAPDLGLEHVMRKHKKAA